MGEGARGASTPPRLTHVFAELAATPASERNAGRGVPFLVGSGGTTVADANIWTVFESLTDLKLLRKRKGGL